MSWLLTYKTAERASRTFPCLRALVQYKRTRTTYQVHIPVSR